MQDFKQEYQCIPSSIGIPIEDMITVKLVYEELERGIYRNKRDKISTAHWLCWRYDILFSDLVKYDMFYCRDRSLDSNG